MEPKSKVTLFIDDETQPFAQFETPVKFELDTRKLSDGLHQLKIVSQEWSGKEGVKVIPFKVRNGPAIEVEGLQENDVVDGIVPLMVNAYSKGDQKKFIIDGSETPRHIPSWLWVLIVAFVGWAIYYHIMSGSIPN
ncbi:cytochrome C [Rhodocytophaga rosea]|uniref:Cytochrome C n=1 Tax=Rhodocytophaga rosea TaxID=2704465 RepID=A0A6C0GG86_9BACT|nr:cytochrome C [Rhodocytophaga rosea]QHT66967.1 cytochrome C [Rhodocytophaga rosea]